MLLSAQQSRLSSLYGPTTMSTARRAADGNTSLAKRKSCDFCYTHKKKCGGDGVNPCRYLVFLSDEMKKLVLMFQGTNEHSLNSSFVFIT